MSGGTIETPRDIKADAREGVARAHGYMEWARQTGDPKIIAWATAISLAAWGFYWNVVGSGFP